MIGRLVVLCVLLAASAAEAQMIPFIRPGRPGEAPPATAPSITFTLPVADSVYETSVVAHVFGGTVAAGSEDVDHVSIQCSGDTTVAETNANLTGTSWSIAVELEVGTTVCLAKVYDDTNPTPLVGQVSKTFIVTNPDADPPVVSAGADDSTANSSYTRTVDVTDDVEATACTWERTGVSATACTLAGSGPTRTAECVFSLAATNDLTTINAITVKCYDQSGQSGTDVVNITRTVALEITTVSVGSCTEDVLCTKAALEARGGTTGTYTWSNNGAGTTLNDADADCAGLSIAANGVISGTPSATAPVTCSFTAKVDDTVTNATKALTVSIVAAGAQTYFAIISALDEAQAITGCTSVDAKGCSLSSMAQLDALADTGDANSYEIDAAMGNAAKLTWDQEAPSLGSDVKDANGNLVKAGNVLRFDLDYNTGEYLFIWDVRYGPEMRSASCGGVIPDTLTLYTHKEYQFPHGVDNGDGSIHFELRNQYIDPALTCADTSLMDVRTYSVAPQSHASLSINNHSSFNAGADQTAGADTTTLLSYPIKHSKWTRYIVRYKFQQDESAFTSWNTKYGITVPDGVYHMASVWVCDEDRDCERIMYEAPIRMNPGASWAVQSLTRSSSTATVTTTGSSITPGVGDTIVIHGATETEYNGVFTVLSKPSATSATFTVSGTPTTPATGTITVGVARTWMNRFTPEHNTSANHTPATGNITITGTAGTVVPNNTVVKRTSNNADYRTEAAVTLNSEGTGTVLIQAVPSTWGGPNGNAPEAEPMTITLAGVTSAVVATGGLTGGAYLLNGDMTLHERWFSVLKNYALPATPEDDTVIFARPVP